MAVISSTIFPFLTGEERRSHSDDPSKGCAFQFETGKRRITRKITQTGSVLNFEDIAKITTNIQLLIGVFTYLFGKFMRCYLICINLTIEFGW